MKQKITISALLAIFILLITNVVQASFQSIYKSNKNDFSTNHATNWISQIRNMEAEGKVMGLNETYDSDTLVSNGCNNIDVHMIKNTEWGAIAILSASTQYGKQPTDPADLTTRYVHIGTNADQKTTTGNVYGIYYSFNYEYVAGGGNTAINTNLDSRYINRYIAGDETSAKPGDATVETKRWHNASYDKFISNGGYVLHRGNTSTALTSGGLFSYSNVSQNIYNNYVSRAVVVSGADF